jgi:STE24 endopeptidase
MMERCPPGIPVLAAAAAAECAARALRPRSGMIAPDPVSAASYFSAAELRRARRFRYPQLALGLAASAVELAVLARWRSGRLRPAAEAVALSAATTAAALPLRAVARRRALRVGLVTQSWRGWGADLAKSAAIGSVLSGAGAEAAAAAIRRWPRGWWAPAAGAAVGLAGAFTFAAPVVLDPIFNRFERLPEGETRDAVLDLARRAGVKVGEVYVVDASRRTTAANAYVTGLGATKRVVLFDTLLEDFTPDEVRLVVAHELAHVRHRDVLRGLAFTAIVAPAAAWGVSRLAQPPTLKRLVLAAGAVMAPVGSAGNRLSRKLENRADVFSLQMTRAVDPFVSFERRIALKNLADPDPPRLLTAVLGTHPSTVQRIGIARAFEASP